MAMTLAEAVARVQRHVDDDGTRWNETTVVRPVLRESLLRCQDILLANGRTELAEEVEVESSTAGLLNLLAYRPRKIHSLSVLNSGRFHQLPAATRAERDTNDGVSRTFRIYMTREMVLPQGSTEPLVGDGMAEHPIMASFAPWVCCVAAQNLAVDDNEQLKALNALEQALRKEVIESPDRPGAIVPPAPPTYLSQVLRWIWVPRTRQVQIVRQWGA